MDPNTLLPLNPRDYLVLFALTEEERHGYGLVKEVERFTDGTVRLDPSNLYRSLKRLIHQGLVVETDHRPTPEASSERRRYYAITQFGSDVVAAEASRLSKLTDAARARNLIPSSGGPS